MEIPELAKYYWPGTAVADGEFFVSAKNENSLLTAAEAAEVIRRAGAYNPWMPADEPPEKPDWDKKVLVLEYDDEIPVVMTMAEVFLDEGSEAEYWKPIILPKQAAKEQK